MTTLLTWAGYSAYQAACLAPWLWFLLIGAGIYGISLQTTHHERRLLHELHR